MMREDYVREGGGGGSRSISSTSIHYTAGIEKGRGVVVHLLF